MVGLRFFEAIEQMGDEPTRRASLLAGLLVLRCAHEALSRDAAPWISAVAMAREHLREVDSFPLRRMLSDMLRECSGDPLPREARIQLEQRLFQYGLDLQNAGEIEPAIDVFGVIIDLARDGSLRLAAMQRKAFAFRVLKQFDESAQWYDNLRQSASAAGDVPMAMEAELGHAKIAFEIGDVPRAQQLVDEILERGRKLKLATLIARALVDRSAIAGTRGDHEAAAHYAFEALRFVQSEATRDRLTVNLGTALRELGRARAADRLLATVEHRSSDDDMRMTAAITRYHLAIDAADWRVAEIRRERLAHRRLSPQRAAEFYEALARHCAANEEFGEAAAALDRMLSVARHHHMNELVFRAEDALADVGKRRVPILYSWRPNIPTARRRRIRLIESEILRSAPAFDELIEVAK